MQKKVIFMADVNEELSLGKNIILSGFKDIDGSSMFVVRKVVGNFVRKIQAICENFENLTLNLKPVHESEKTSKFEIHGKLIDNGKVHTAENTDRNLFFSLDKVLSKLEMNIKEK
jgi:hypothetical protein